LGELLWCTFRHFRNEFLISLALEYASLDEYGSKFGSTYKKVADVTKKYCSVVQESPQLLNFNPCTGGKL
jgi:hypothetical protein